MNESKLMAEPIDADYNIPQNWTSDFIQYCGYGGMQTQPIKGSKVIAKHKKQNNFVDSSSLSIQINASQLMQHKYLKLQGRSVRVYP